LERQNRSTLPHRSIPIALPWPNKNATIFAWPWTAPPIRFGGKSRRPVTIWHNAAYDALKQRACKDAPDAPKPLFDLAKRQPIDGKHMRVSVPVDGSDSVLRYDVLSRSRMTTDRP